MSPTALWDSLSLFILNTHFFNEISEAFIILCFEDSISFEKQIQRSLLSAEQLLLFSSGVKLSHAVWDSFIVRLQNSVLKLLYFFLVCGSDLELAAIGTLNDFFLIRFK